MKFAASSCNLLNALVLMLACPVTVTAQCTDLHIVFARGTGEKAGFGICGTPFVSELTSKLANLSVSSYAVNYAASVSQLSAGPGATDMTNHVKAVAQQCPNTVFVLGGYSQGASVTNIAIGIKIPLAHGEVIPETLAPRIKAVVTFGNPLKLTGRTIKSSSQLYGPKAIEFCNKGDPICGNGFNIKAHLAYPKDGSVARAASEAAGLVQGGRST